MTQLNPYSVLQVAPSATETEVAAAYARLQTLYSAERYVDGPPEFAAQAASKRAELDVAYATLVASLATAAIIATAATLSAEELDFRPLPPARGQERPTPPAPERPAAKGRTTLRQPRPLVGLGILLALIIGVFVLVSVSGVRTYSDAAALATPVLAELPLPYAPAEVATLRQNVERQPTFENWVLLGNALFDNLETLRENAPFSAQYLGAARTWPDASEAYRQALSVRDDPFIRTDLALTLVYYANAVNDPVTLAQGLREAEQAWAAGKSDPRVMINYGLVLVALDPPQITEAIKLWQALIAQAPTSLEAQRAQTLITAYQPRGE